MQDPRDRFLDARQCVYLPPPKDHYVISRTLKIGSEQELRLDRFTRIRLAPKSDCPMLENRCYRAGTGTNAFVAVTGGVWDMDNLSQSANFLQTKEGRAKRPKVHTPSFFLGMALRFCHVENLTVRDCRMTNKLAQPIKFLDVRGRVQKLVNENNTFAGAWDHPSVSANTVTFATKVVSTQEINLPGTGYLATHDCSTQALVSATSSISFGSECASIVLNGAAPASPSSCGNATDQARRPSATWRGNVV